VTWKITNEQVAWMKINIALFATNTVVGNACFRLHETSSGDCGFTLKVFNHFNIFMAVKATKRSCYLPRSGSETNSLWSNPPEIFFENSYV